MKRGLENAKTVSVVAEVLKASSAMDSMGFSSKDNCVRLGGKLPDGTVVI